MRAYKLFAFAVLTVTLPFFLGGCFAIGPVRSATSSQDSVFFVAPTKAVQPTTMPAAASTAVITQPADCTKVLSYIEDLSIPDGTFESAGSSLDKKWHVRNNGTCNWDGSYSLRLISGDTLGAANPQALVPARSGTEATIEIIFTAPSDPGTYSSTWQAYDGDGQPFGDTLYITFNVPN